MSYKATSQITNGQWKTASLLDTNAVKLAGEEAKDRLYEPKHKKKLVRVLTVVAYVFFVSLAAIMLSLYYVFLWNGDQKLAPKYITSAPKHQAYHAADCKTLLEDMREQLTALESQVKLAETTPTPPEENVTTWQEEYSDSSEDLKTSVFMKKLFGSDKDDENY